MSDEHRASSLTDAPIDSGASRRAVLLSLGALVSGLACPPQQLWAAISHGRQAGPHRSLLEALCDLLIPDTDTPGARAAGVPDFVELALGHGLRQSDPQLLAAVTSALDAAAGGSFVALASEQRTALLTDVDNRAFAKPVDPQAPPLLGNWARLKALIVIGYYTSETGGSVELRYELVPGRFEPDIPVVAGDRAWSSDWTGVKYA
jgi:Gluconate 2-dehydrogenase subunit 3